MSGRSSDACCGAQPFNILRYTNGQHYDSHYDIFEPESYGPQSSQRVRSACRDCQSIGKAWLKQCMVINIKNHQTGIQFLLMPWNHVVKVLQLALKLHMQSQFPRWPVRLLLVGM